MDTMAAFVMGQAYKDDEHKVFDWDKAAKIIKERGAKEASAGLSGDWGWTGGPILKNGKPVPKEETYTYLASNWATPELDIDDEIMPCFIMKSKTVWDSDTYWPESALEILRKGGKGYEQATN